MGNTWLVDFESKTTVDMADSGSTVVVCMDESEHALHALKYYASYIHKPNNKVVLLHCGQYVSFNYGSVSLVPGNPSLVEKMINEEENRINTLLKRMEQELKNLEITNGEVVRIHGEAGHEVVEKAKSLNADLIVTGSRGMGTIRRTLLGSVSDYIVHHSHVPVLVCKHPDFHHKQSKEDNK